MPVVIRDVDVFGYPEHEVLDVLTASPHPSVTLPRAASPTGYLAEVRVAAV
ncbi:hypothetical protein [Streptomyces sp. NPDC051921]|uniref:hypothetical protein n=1 Tax=Streptomyces sp. NPDC051921 TaxID=3155806 RepID=UPI00343FA64A